MTDPSTPNEPSGTSRAATTNGHAIAALVLGIGGFVICGIGAILALVFGYQAKREIDASGGAQKGRGMAVAGIVLGWLWVASVVVAGIVLLVLWIA